jgi:hypothetical protein
VDRFIEILEEDFERHQYLTGPAFSVDETGYQLQSRVAEAIACRRNRKIASLILAKKEE